MFAVGIDVSKGKSTIAIIKDGEILEKPFCINHDLKGFEKLLKKLEGIDKKEIKFVMEATGVYHLPLLVKLLDLDFWVTVENAYLLKKYFDVYLRKVKTDKQDSIKIAKYCYSKWHELKKYSLQDSTYQDLLFLSRQYDQIMSLKVKAKVQFKNLLDVIFPGFSNCFYEDNNQFLFMLDVFQKFYHPSLIMKYSENEFISKLEILNKKRGLRTVARIASELHSLAKNTISARPANESTQLIAFTCVENLRRLEKATNDILTQMDKIATTLPEFEVVSSMSGVGKKIRSRLIAEIGDINKFSSANSLIAYAGIDTPPYDSGGFHATERHITKRGNKHLRKCGFEIMKSLKTIKPSQDSSVYDFMIKKESEGKALKSCKIAALNKFLRIYYARVKAVYLKT